MRLIDADKLIDALGVRGCYKYENPKAYDTLMLYEILGAIEDQPTAYDVDEVIVDLSRAENFDSTGHSYVSTIEAINIVRIGGGINDDE